uniref:RHS repeat-associated core domain-containing protein n=1 Tax=Streptomyces purpeochromogenes TaxID=1464077 RepID=UPI000515AFEF
ADETGTKVNTYAYSPRGVQRAGTTEQVHQPYRFAGGYARYYDPNIGRFTTPDPSGQEKNPYLYAAGDPVNKIDPTGLAFLDVLGPAGDLIQAGQHLAEGDTKALWGDVAGAVTGGGVATYCASAVVAAPLTLGASLGFAAGCYAASWAVSQIAQIPFN